MAQADNEEFAARKKVENSYWGSKDLFMLVNISAAATVAWIIN